MTTIRRKLAGFLTVVMVFTQLSPAAMAAENDSGVVVVAAAEESAKEAKETKAEPAKAAAAEAPAKTDASEKTDAPVKMKESANEGTPSKTEKLGEAEATVSAPSEPSAEASDPALAEEPDPAWTDESGPSDTTPEPSSGEPDQEPFSAIVEEVEEDEPSKDSGIADAIPVEEAEDNPVEDVEETPDADSEEAAVIDAIQTEDEILSDQPEETETEEENKEAAMPAQELTAEDPSGIKVTILVPENTLPENSNAKIVLFDENKARESSDMVNPMFTDVLGFDLAFYDAEGNVTEPAEEELEYIVTLPEDQKLASPRKTDDPFVILYQDAEGEVKTEQIDPENENVDARSAHFITNHVAPFIIASPEEKDDSTFTAKVKDPSDPSGKKEIQITMTAPASSLPCLERELSLQAEVVKAKEAKEYVESVENEIDDAEDVKRETVLFDIRLMRGDQEVEPAGPVSVTFSGVEIPNDDAQVFHVEEAEDTAGTANSEDKENAENNIEVEEMTIETTKDGDVVMDTDHFSFYALTYTVESYFKTASGETYKITVSYDDSAQIPTGVELYVRELEPETSEYQEYLEKTAEALNMESTDTMTFARFFDIELRKDGEKVNPKAPVEVKIEYTDAPEKEDGAVLNVVHFADDGTEVIEDVRANDDVTEIVYEQSSFSVTGTIVTNPAASDQGEPYLLVAKYNGQYFNVLSDGSLQPATDVGNNKVKTDQPMVWLLHSEGGKQYLRYKAEGYDHDWTQQASTFAYTYIDPTAQSGLSTDVTKKDADGKDIKINGVTQFDSPKSHCNIILDDRHHLYRQAGNNYAFVAVNQSGTAIQGGLDPFQPSELEQINNTEFYLAKVDFYDGTKGYVKKHLVDHIDISVTGNAQVTVPLAYGNYYDEEGNVILTVTSPTNITLERSVTVSQENIRTAQISAHLDNGQPVDNAFYITGYTSNAEALDETPQVRIEGIFKVANLGVVPNNEDGNSAKWKNLRLQNKIWYSVSATEKDVEFTYTYNGQVLYDRAGNPLTITGDVTIEDDFHYWMEPDKEHGIKGNTCPPLDPAWGIYQYCWDGRIHSFENSGMDFRLSGDGAVTLEKADVEINKSIVDEDGNPIYSTDLSEEFKFNVYENAGASPNEVKELNVGHYDTPANYEGFVHSSTQTMDYDGSPTGVNTIFLHDFPQGMVYIDEDKESIQDQFTDVNGDIWVYKETTILTEYVWRQDGDEDKLHYSDTYTKQSGSYRSIPEVLGHYENASGEDEFNGFLEFHVNNVYEKVEPHKEEVTPYPGTGLLGPVHVDDKIQYQIHYKNYKTAPANVVIKDTLDPNVQFVTASNNGSLQKSGEDEGRVVWTLTDVPAGEEGTVTLTVKVLEGALKGNDGPGSVVNGGDTATVQVGNDSAISLNTVENPLPEKKESSPYYGNGVLGPVKVGDTITYEINYRNYKEKEATVTIKDQIDKNVAFVSATEGGALQTEGENAGCVVWTLNNVQPGAEGIVKVTVRVLEGALKSSGGSGNVVNNGDTAYVQVGNDAAFTLNTVENPLPEKREINRNGTETYGYQGIGVLGPVKVGDTISYEINYRNYKTDAATVTIKDKLDPNVEFVSAVSDINTDGVCADGVVTWTLPSVPAGREGTVTLTVKVLEGALKSNGGSGNVVNGGDTATVQVDNDAAFSLNTVENPLPEKKETAPYEGTGVLGGVRVGDEITYEICYRNYKSTASDVVITDTLDPNVAFVHASDGGTKAVVGGKDIVTWTLLSVPAGREGTVALTVKVLESALESNGGEGKVVNGGDTASVQVGNDAAFTLNEVENPVPVPPVKKETDPYVSQDPVLAEETLGAVKVGDEITYTISYTNYKDDFADITIKDTLDPYVAFVSADEGGTHDGATAGGVVTWNLRSIPAGNTGIVTLTVRVLATASQSNEGPGKVVNGGNTATVKVGNDKEFTLNKVENPVPEEPHKEEIKLNGVAKEGYQGTGVLGSVKVGDEITYQISYINYKNTPATVTIKDTLDPHVEFVSASNGGELKKSGEEDEGRVVWTLSDIPAGGSGRVTLTVEVLDTAKVDHDPEGPGKVVNGGESATVQVDNDQEYTLETVENPVPSEPKKREIQPYEGTGTLGPVKVGDEITYQIDYVNNNDSAATISIVDKLDSNVAFVSASNDGNHSEGIVTWRLENVPAKSTGSVTLTVKVKDSAVSVRKVENEAEVYVGNTKFVTDKVTNPVPDEPHKKETVPYEGTGELGAVKVGQEITYEISYRNYKTTAATVVITDALDKNVQFVSASDTGHYIYDSVTHTIIWTFENVQPSQASSKVTLTVKVLDSAKTPGEVVNTAKVNVGNDGDVDTETVINPVPDDPQKKETVPYEGTGVLGAVKVGDEITYQISYKNYKSVNADVVIKDKLDAHVAFVSANSGGTHSNGIVTWTLADVPAGQEGTVTLTVKVLESALVSKTGPGKVVNGGDTATVRVGNDQEYTLNEVENPVPEEPEKKEIALNGDNTLPAYQGTGTLGGVKVGDRITYQINYTNYKAEKADITIKDTLDANVKFCSASDGGTHDGEPAGGIVTWTIPDVDPGSGSVTLTVEVLEGALVSNRGEGKVVNGGSSSTVKIGNDNEFTLNTVENPVPEVPEKKEITPYEGVGALGSVKVGEEITYQISYKNYKSAKADVVIKDQLDEHVAFVSADNGGTNAGGVVTWTLTDVPAGQEGTVTLTVKVLESALESKDGPGKVVNGGETATVKVGNDSEYTLNTVENPVPEKPEKRETAPYVGTGELGMVKPGQEITYQIDYVNYEDSPEKVVITDALDPNVEFVSADNDGVCEEKEDAGNKTDVVTWTLDNVDAGYVGSVTLTVRVKEEAKTAGQVVNTATVQVGNNHAIDTETVTNPVPDQPHKQETNPDQGYGELCAVRVGDRITYEISYKNYKSKAADIVITDRLDSNVKLISASNNGKNQDGVVTWTLSKVAAGAVGTVTLTVEVLETAKTPGRVVNTAKVNVGNDGDVDTETVINPVPDDPQKKELTPYEGTGTLGAVKVGDEITYEIAYKNYKSTPATVVIKDQLDANVSYKETTVEAIVVPAATDQTDPTSVTPVKKSEAQDETAPMYEFTEPQPSSDRIATWSIENVPAGGTGTVRLTVTVLEGALVSEGGPGKVVNGGETASVKVGNDSEYTLNTVENPVPEEPEKKEKTPYEGTGVLGAVKVDDEITYEISYKNYKSAAVDIVIKDTLDPHVTYVDSSNGGDHDGSSNGGIVTWTLRDVPAGREGTVTLKVKVLESALESKRGPGKVVNGGDNATVKVGNDHEYTLNEVENPVPEEPHKKEIKLNGEEKAGYQGTGMLGPVKVDDQITYEISYKNYKAAPATVVIKDQLDAHVDFVSATSDVNVNGVHAEGVITWTLPDVPAGHEGTVTLTVKVLSSAQIDHAPAGPGEVVNGGDTATVKVGNDAEYTLDTVVNPVPSSPKKRELSPYQGTGDPVIDPETGTETDVGELGPVKRGDLITYQIDYVNNTDDDHATVTITDQLDSNVIFKEASNGGSNDSGTVTWTITDVPAKSVGSVTLTVRVKEDTELEFDVKNKASVSVNNNTAQETNTIINPVPDAPHKEETSPDEGTGELNRVNVGDVITYEISYKNYKSKPVNIVITDELDKNVQFISADRGGKVSNGVVTWNLIDVEAGENDHVTLKVKVLDKAKTEGRVRNTASVKVGNDAAVDTEEVINPVPDEPKKREILLNGKSKEGYIGTGTLGAVKVGDKITYEISYKNYKSVPAAVVIKDQLDAHVKFVSAESDVHVRGVHQDGVVTWTLRDVPAGHEGTVTLTVEVLESALTSYIDSETNQHGPGKVVNGGDTATVQVGNDSVFTLDTVENPVPEAPEKKETAPYEGTGVLGFVKVGDEITYEISYKNYKEEAAQVVIHDTLDSNVEFVSATSDAGIDGVHKDGVVIWTLPSVAAQKTGKVTLTVKVLKGALKSEDGTGNVINGGETATVQVGNDAAFTLNTVENPLPEKKEINRNGTETDGYQGTGVLGPVKVGDTISYEIRYRNYKPDAATVTIKDKLDPNVEFVSAVSDINTDGVCADGVVTWTLPSVPAGREGTVTLTVKVLKGALKANGGSGNVVNGGDTATVQVDNDTAFSLNTVENPVPEKKETAPYEGTGVLGGVKAGEEITYEICYRNYKSADSDVVIKDQLDPNVELVSATSDAGTEGVLEDGVVTWTLTNVEAGKEGTVTLTVRVLESAMESNGGPGKVVNGGDTASVKVGNDEAFTLNEVENPVPVPPVKKETDPYVSQDPVLAEETLGAVKVGDVITYTISYTNYKKDIADITIKDQLDPNVEFVSATSDAGEEGIPEDGVVTWILHDVDPGTKGKVTLSVRVKDAAQVSKDGPGKVVNGGDTASVRVGNDHEYTLNTVENPVPEQPVKQEVAPYTGTGELGPVKVGDKITYEITYENYKSDAAKVVIKDQLDPHVDFISAVSDTGVKGVHKDGVVTWTLEDVPEHTKGKVTLVVQVKNTALVSVNNGPGKVVNGGDTASVRVGNDSEYTLNTVENPVPEPPHKKEKTPYEGNGVLGAVAPNDEITYEITCRNYLKEDADIVIKDKLDANVTFVSASDGGELSGDTVIWTLKDVAPDTEQTVTLTVTVKESALASKKGPGKVVNGGDTATVKVGNDKEYALETVENPVVENTFIKVAKVDKDNTSTKLPGAHLVLLDAKGSIVAEWDSTDKVHQVNNLAVGAAYTLRETKAPSRYGIASDITFKTGVNGKVTGTDSLDSDGITILMKDEAIPSSAVGVVKVTKYTLKSGRAFRVKDQTYYTALFSDSKLTKRVTDVKALKLKNSYTTSVTFTRLALGTYYVAETDQLGNPVKPSGVTKVVYSNKTVTLSQSSKTAESVIQNTVSGGVLGAVVPIHLEVKKKVTTASGKAKKVSETFRFALFSDAGCTKRVSGTGILTIKLKNKSSGTVTFENLPYSDHFYVAEVGKNGKPVGSSFKYKVSYSDNNGPVYSEANDTTVTVTNKAKKVAGDNRDQNNKKTGNAGDDKSTAGGTTPVKTGDETPVVPLMVTMLFAGAAALFLALRRRRLRRN